MNNDGGKLDKPIAIYYEHPDWFRPLFQQLDERGVNWLKIDARHHHYDAASPEREYSLLFNRMSPPHGSAAWPTEFSIRWITWHTWKRKACAW